MGEQNNGLTSNGLKCIACHKDNNYKLFPLNLLHINN